MNLVLKDFSLGMPLPTVGAIAWDPATFPERSEIVFTAGTASSPAKAAIRAVTEVAQLGGDFCTGACYEASGLPKFTNLDDIAWLLKGDTIQLDDLPSALSDDIRQELLTGVNGLAPINVYAVETTNKDVGVPAHYPDSVSGNATGTRVWVSSSDARSAKNRMSPRQGAALKP